MCKESIGKDCQRSTELEDVEYREGADEELSRRLEFAFRPMTEAGNNSPSLPKQTKLVA